MRACYQDMIEIRDSNLGNSQHAVRAERAKKNKAIAITLKGIRTAWRIKEASVTFISLALAILAYLGGDLIPSLVLIALNIIAAQYRDDTGLLASVTRDDKIWQGSKYRGIVYYHFAYHFGGKFKLYLVSLLRYGNPD